MNIKAIYIVPTIKVHKLGCNLILSGSGLENPLEGDSKSSFADFGDTSDFDEAPYSSWDNSTY